MNHVPTTRLLLLKVVYYKVQFLDANQAENILEALLLAPWLVSTKPSLLLESNSVVPVAVKKKEYC